MSLADEQSTVKALVLAVDGEIAVVEVEAGGCGRCHEEGGCGGQNLTQMFAGKQKTFRVKNTIGAVVGERVTIAIAAGSVRRTANLAYGLPIVSCLAGAISGSALAGDKGAMLGAALALALSFIYVRFRSTGSSGNFNERPFIVSRSQSSQEVCGR